MAHKVSIPLGSIPLSIETGKIAKQADGAVVIQQGGTVVFVSACCNPNPSPMASDVVPLTVDYREKSYAAGRIPGGFFKREGRPPEHEILTARLIDRPIRPLFPKGFQHELQIMAMTLSSDGEHNPDVLAVLGASAALRVSDIPFPESIAAVRMAQVNGDWVVNPTFQQIEQGGAEVVIIGSKKGILAIEASCKEVPEQQIMEALTAGYEHIKKLVELQDELVKVAGKPKRTAVTIYHPPESVLTTVRQKAAEKIRANLQAANKEGRNEARETLQAALVKELAPAGGTVTAQDVSWALGAVEHEVVREQTLKTKQRVDGRGYTDLRPVTCEVGVLPRTHGSALFTRGETQSLAVTTLGTSDDEQLIESLEGKHYKRFMLHYNFPPFSVGEVRPIRGTGRREIGHGALAEKALRPVVPSKDEFPYTMRVVSEIFESNGSSSMASVCAGSLALMDAGVPVKAGVSGIALGLIKNGSEAAILSDIAGMEDHHGDMDFKVAGTALGITAVQYDTKLKDGLSLDLIQKIISQANAGRMKLLEIMTKAIERPRESLSVYAPRILTIKINTEWIRDVIGPGGRVIRKIIEETGVAINVEDDGRISIASADSKASDRAVEIIRGLTEDVEVGKIYPAKVKRITNFGAFCELIPIGKEGLVHISQLANEHVKSVEDVVKLGDEFKVEVIEIDEQGRINLSRKRLLEKRSS